MQRKEGEGQYGDGKGVHKEGKHNIYRYCIKIKDMQPRQ